MGGRTDARVNQDEARMEGGFGGTEALEGDAYAARMRRGRGYGGERDMRRDVGAMDSTYARGLR